MYGCNSLSLRIAIFRSEISLKRTKRKEKPANNDGRVVSLRLSGLSLIKGMLYVFRRASVARVGRSASLVRIIIFRYERCVARFVTVFSRRPPLPPSSPRATPRRAKPPLRVRSTYTHIYTHTHTHIYTHTRRTYVRINWACTSGFKGSIGARRPLAATRSAKYAQHAAAYVTEKCERRKGSETACARQGRPERATVAGRMEARSSAIVDRWRVHVCLRCYSSDVVVALSR